jgi:hypothetical protein
VRTQRRRSYAASRRASTSAVDTPAWLAVATDVKVGKTYQYGVIAFSDDLTQPWVSQRLTTAAKPVVY